jgi:hypothetical protein
VPILPRPRQLQAPSPVPDPRNTWDSINSPPTTGWLGPQGGVSTNISLNVIGPRPRSTVSPVDRARPRPDTGQSTTIRRPHDGVLVFRASLTPESFQVLEPRAPSEEPFVCARSLLLYDLGTELYQTTRRLVFLPSEDADSAERREFWMPLADTAVARRGAHVIISWSDCNHHESYNAVNGITPHSRVYRRTRPNNTLSIHFESPSDARDFASEISEPRKAKAALKRRPINLSPYAISGAWGFDATTGDIQKCSALVNYTVQPFDCHLNGRHEPSRGLLVKGGDDLTTSTSRLYWLPPAIDIQLGMDKKSENTEPRPVVSLMDLFVADYKSNIQRVHNWEKNKVGVFQEAELSKCSASWRFENVQGKFHFYQTSWAQVLTSLKIHIRSWMASAHGLCDNAPQ